MIGRLGFIMVASLLLGNSGALALDSMTLHSRSGQFVVRGMPLGLQPTLNSPGTSYVRLDPSVTIVSCERIKDALLSELNLPDEWRHTIGIALRPVEGYDDPIQVLSMHYSDGWSYRMDIPDQVDRAKLMKAMVQVLLLEVANRTTPVQSAEVPDWLSDGLAAHLQAITLGGLALEPATWTVRQGRKVDRIAATREMLRINRSMSVEQLSWPASGQPAGPGGYSEFARLFVGELLHLSGGRECMRDMIRGLGKNLNWQATFLESFGRHFRAMAEVEKWWTLRVTHLSGVDSTSMWTPEQTLAQLDEALVTQVQARQGTNNLPAAERVELSTIIDRWAANRQRSVLESKLRLLQAIKSRAATPLATLVEAYCGAIEEYLHTRRTTHSLRESIEPRRKPRALGVAARILALDAAREAVRREIRAHTIQTRVE